MVVVNRSLKPAKSGSGIDRLQWVCDNIKSLNSTFYNYRGEGLEKIIEGLDTSQVTSMYSTFRTCTALTKASLDCSSCTTFEEVFAYCSSLTELNLKNTNKITNMRNAFRNTAITKLSLDCSSTTSLSNIFASCSKLVELNLINSQNKMKIDYGFDGCLMLEILNVSNPIIANTSTYGMFNNCKSLSSFPVIDLYNITSKPGNMFYNCVAMTNLTLKNIKYTLIIGSGTFYGHLLTLDSLLNTIKELWNMTDGTAQTLTIGSANLEKLANVYVKLIDITDEMRAEDEYIDNKLPFEICESTDEGAMLITDYALLLKNWSIE